MTKHFSTVPIDGALRATQHANSDRLRPLSLIVDDDPLITATLAAILSGSGLAALTARDGPSALDTARLIPPEILISDLAIPGMDGFELALQVTASAPDCDVILFAGHAAAFNLGKLMRGFKREFTVLIKPVHPVDLLHAVFTILSRRGQLEGMSTAFCKPASNDFLYASRSASGPSATNSNVTRRLRPRGPAVHSN